MAKLENKWGQKIASIHFFNFWVSTSFLTPYPDFLHIFAVKVSKMRLKLKNSKKWILAIFRPHLFSNLAKFQLYSSITAKVDSKNVFLRYRDFKLWDPFLAKFGPFSRNISKYPKNIGYFWVLNDTNHGDTWKTIKNQV